ncbi:hypothetical protein [Streptomyces aureus]|uniref:hypothetical protein n=1 Tax=Streptomyces aureus TaxID=193461 RepID=UPI0005660B81|nr:hypothetical protein [Streptomyces aureus]
MAASTRVRRLLAGATATGLLAGGAALGLSGTATAAPAHTTAATALWDHDRTYKWVYVQGHWHHYWVKGYWDCRHM